MPVKHVHAILNPAAGQGDFPMREFNRELRQHGVAWSASVTGADADGERQAREAIAAGADVILAYGGDGTVADVARGMEETGVPLAILPGGAANGGPTDLDLPGDAAEAARLIAGVATDGEPVIREIDAATANGKLFLLRLEVGMQADMLTQTDREAKEQFGVWAYWMNTLRHLAEPPTARYTFRLDDSEPFEMSAASVIVTNMAGMGRVGKSLCPDIEPDDGKLDLMVIEPRHVESLLSVTRSLADWLREADPFPHYQAERITVSSDPPQTVVFDGEPQGRIKVEAKVLPRALKVVVPPAGGEA